MNYTYQTFDLKYFNEFIIGNTDLNVFANVDFLNAVSDVYGFGYSCDVIFLNEKPVLFTVIIVSKQKIVFPNHYFYQFIWEKNKNEESWVQLEAWDFLIKRWKEKYNSINIRLPIKTNDLRPFIWNDFSIKLKYTYIKDIKELDYHVNINRIIKKKQEIYSFDKNCNWTNSWVFHFNDLQKFGVREINANKYIEYFKALHSKNILQVFNAYHQGVFLSSIVAIIDLNEKKAYFPLIGTAERHYNTGLPSILYNYALTELRNLNIESVDLFGANIKNIARFKSKFFPDLQSFYEVSYSKRNRKIQKLFMDFRCFFKRILYWI